MNLQRFSRKAWLCLWLLLPVLHSCKVRKEVSNVASAQETLVLYALVEEGNGLISNLNLPKAIVNGQLYYLLRLNHNNLSEANRWRVQLLGMGALEVNISRNRGN